MGNWAQLYADLTAQAQAGQPLSFCLCPGFGTFIKSYNDVTARLLQIQGMCMSLAAVTDYCDCFIL